MLKEPCALAGSMWAQEPHSSWITTLWAVSCQVCAAQQLAFSPVAMPDELQFLIKYMMHLLLCAVLNEGRQGGLGDDPNLLRTGAGS